MERDAVNEEVRRAREALALVDDALAHAETFDHEELLDVFLKSRVALSRANEIVLALTSIRRSSAEKIVAPGPRGWGWSQARLAREAGVSPSRVHQLLQRPLDDADERHDRNARLTNDQLALS